jgi:ABC-type nitrate/sulfonate/bicarbonate transport system ATPase subunit
MDKKKQYPHELSGGQRQRIAIIQQMLCNTHFILMDEPFSGLDVKMKHEVCRFIQEVAEVDEFNTTIFTTHDIETACMIADTVWVMGYDKDEKGQNIPGARIVQTFNLIERGLAWNPQALSHPNFIPTVREIMALFMA